MKKYLLASIALAVSMGVAHAGDGKFDGIYGGVQGSYATGKNTDDTKVDGFGAGVFGGYGKTFGKWYVGGELSGDYTGVDGSDHGSSAKKQYQYGIAARAGYLIKPSILGYGVVGWERGGFKASNADGSIDSEINGIRAGLGVETFLRQNVSLRTEVDYTDWKGKEGLGKGHEYTANVGVAYHF